MISRRRAILALALSGAVSGCSNRPSDGLLEQVQEAVAAACRFVPLISTILAIIDLHDGTLSTVQQIAAAICDALVAAQRARTTPEIHGVPVHGYYVRH